MKLKILTETIDNTETAREFIREVIELGEKYNANFFIVTDGASATRNNGNNDAVRNARLAQIEWEKRNGFDPDEDWLNTQNV